MTKTSQRENLYQRSLEIILTNQQPGGAFLACPVMPDYQFSWFRDGAYVAYALTLARGGNQSVQRESAANFHNWCVRVISSRAEQLERNIARAAKGEPIDLADTLNARYLPDGSEGPKDWPEFQLDGPGTWLWSLREYVEAAGIHPLPAAWEQAIELTMRYLTALWKHPCHDYWEELPNDIHISTLASIYAGLKAASALVPRLKTDSTLLAIREFVLSRGLTPGGELAKSVGRDMVDGNLISVATPCGLLAPDDPLMLRTMARIERDLGAAGGGVYRHREDVYYGGGPWVLLALWQAWYYVERGNRARASEILTWVETQADAQGNLPEQVNHPLLAPEHYAPWVEKRGPIANPLLWCHAKYIIVCNKLNLV